VPELDDVEHFREIFRRRAAGKEVSAVTVDPTILRNTDAETLRRSLPGHRFEDPERHGKWLICWTDGPALLLHFGMTGDLIWSGEEPARHRHDRLILEFREGGELRYRNMRKLGGVWLAHGRGEVEAILGGLGPDALGLGRREFETRLARRRGGVKAALMDQGFVAGVGNLLADEILWQARLHPRRTVGSLTEEERGRLYSVLHRVLRESVRGHGAMARRRSWFTPIRGVAGGACPRCGTALTRTVVAGRTTYLCPNCQRTVG